MDDLSLTYEIQEQLSIGTFSTLFKAKHKLMGTELAIKVVEKQKLWQSQVNVEKMENELITIEQIRHPNIVSILELLQDDHNYYIVTEYLTEGNLLQYL